METIFSIAILIFSVVVHEVSHGYAAKWLGDSTAEREGRLTLNPIKHLDPFGSVILPALLALINAGFIVGWAKPVPYNPANFGGRRWGEAAVAAAGPLSNIILALIFAGAMRVLAGFEMLSSPLAFILSTIVLINLFLAVFNLMPAPPLDGSKILFYFIPQRYWKFRAILEQYSLVILLALIFFVWDYVVPFVIFIFSWLVGIA